MKNNNWILFVAYYIFAGFVLYGVYHIVVELDRSKWYLLALLLLGLSPTPLTSKS